MQNTKVPIWWQARRLTKLLLVIYIPVIITIIALAIQSQIPVRMLLEDPAVYSKVPFYTGIVSNIGVLLWISAAVVCWFTYYLACTTQLKSQLCWFLLSSAVMISFLAVDDWFLLHDQILPDYLNIPELVFFPIYGVAILVYLIHFRQIFIHSEYFLLVLALTFFAVSLAVDNFEHFTPDQLTRSMRGIAADNDIIATTDTNTSPLHAFRLLVEDGAKLMGVAAWAAYFIRFCSQVILEMNAPNSAE